MSYCFTHPVQAFFVMSFKVRGKVLHECCLETLLSDQRDDKAEESTGAVLPLHAVDQHVEAKAELGECPDDRFHEVMVAKRRLLDASTPRPLRLPHLSPEADVAPLKMVRNGTCL